MLSSPDRGLQWIGRKEARPAKILLRNEQHQKIVLLRRLVSNANRYFEPHNVELITDLPRLVRPRQQSR